MKYMIKSIWLIYIVIARTLLNIIGLVSWPIRKFLQWVYLIDESQLENSLDSSYVKLKIRQNKRINLMFLFEVNDRIEEWFKNKLKI